MLKYRIITALILFIFALIALFGISGTAFEWVVAVVICACAWEWGTLMGGVRKRIRFAYGTSALVLMILVMTAVLPGDEWIAGTLHTVLLATLIASCAWWVIAAILVTLYPVGQSLWHSWPVKAVIGWLTLVPFAVSLVSLRSLPQSYLHVDGSWILLTSCFMVWAADTGAYFAGRAFGKHKMMPRVSPGKTMEGLLGGLALSSVIIWLAAWLLSLSGTRLLAFAIFSYLSVVMAVYGDLAESMLKRAAGVKDSGNMLPGHGGLLDRVDSLTAAIPIFTLGVLFWAV